MTREEALNKIRQMSLPKETMEILEALAPELRESDDERTRKALIEVLHRLPSSAFDYGAEGGYLGATKEQMLAYLEKQKEQKPEWSEEDEKDVAHIIRVLDDCYAYGKHDLNKTDHENLVGTLKSLRPSWKPSEEQMEALKNSAYGAYQNGDGPALRELYEQLKNL